MSPVQRCCPAEARTSRWVIPTLLALAAVAASTDAAQGRKNLLTNGGFEDGTLGWQVDPKQRVLLDAKAARKGRGCVFGEVSSPNRHCSLVRNVRVRQKNLYEFEIWARATNGTKLVLWVVQPGAKQRTMVSVWQNVTSKWKRYTTPITATADGEMTLRIIAPSSHGAPVGTMWLDDVAMYETRMPECLNISEGKGFNDEPTMALADDDGVYVAWLSFRDEQDTLQVARLRPKGEAFEKLGRWQVPTRETTGLIDPALVPAGDGAMLLYAAESKGDWDIHAVSISKDGLGKPSPICPAPGTDVRLVGVWRAGTLFVAWESNRDGVRQILFSESADGAFAAPKTVSHSDAAGYSPSIALLDSGELCVAWHSFRGNNYDVYLRRRSEDGSWADARRLTRAPTIDRHPVLVARGNDLWLAYENAQINGYRIGATNRRRLIVAKVTPNGLLAPRGYANKPLFQRRCEAADAAFDAKGRLWIAHLQPRLPRAGWDPFLIGYAGTQWSELRRASGQKGLDRAPSMAILGNRAILAIQSDNVPGGWKNAGKTATAESNVYLCSMNLGHAPKASTMAVTPLTEPNEPFEAADFRMTYGEAAPSSRISYEGKRLELLYGSLHEHSDVSVCNRCGDQSLDESYQHMRDIARLDFACMTDHGYNQNPYIWHYSAKKARIHDDPNRFTTFLGFEWTSTFEKYSDEHPYGYYGHRNLILSDLYFPRWWNARDGMTPSELWAELRAMDADFVHIPHQLADTGNVPCDWSFHDEKAQPVAEIFQVRGSYEYIGAPRQAKRSTPKGYYLQDAWARDIVIGVIASPDHGGGIGKVAVFSRDRSREAILDALRSRHCYGTTAAKIFLDVRVNGRLMGEKIDAPEGKPVVVTIRADCPGEIDRIEVCRSNEFIHCRRPASRSTGFTFVDEDPLSGKSYYYVRLIQKDEEIAWTSPVWLGYEQGAQP